MNSPRYAPAGLLVEQAGVRVAIDGGPGAEPPDHLDAWLVTDLHAERIGRFAAWQAFEACGPRWLVTGLLVSPSIHIRWPIPPIPPSAISSSPMAGGWSGRRSSSSFQRGLQGPT